MASNNHYNKANRPLAKANRQSMTKAEACLWKYALSKKQMLGYPFRRQRPIENYIVDFVCLPLKLIIEVDGFSHQIPENEEKDLDRQQKLESLGFTVMRFTDKEVLGDLRQTRELLQRKIELLEAG
jgi:very-short-patch-repair endonuclease